MDTRIEQDFSGFVCGFDNWIFAHTVGLEGGFDNRIMPMQSDSKYCPAL